MPSFVSTEFVSLLVQSGMCGTSVEAIALGQFLLDEGYIARCSKKDISDPFSDELWSLFLHIVSP